MKPGYVVVGNVRDPDSCLRMGARVVVEWVPGNPAKAQVRGLSRGGRRVTKWVPTRRLTKLRVAWEEKPRWPTYATRELAEQAILVRLEWWHKELLADATQRQGKEP